MAYRRYRRQTRTQATGPLEKIIKVYDNLEAYIADLSTDDYAKQSSIRSSPDWAGSVDFADAVNQARTGLELEKIDLAVNGAEKLTSSVIAPVYGVSGAYVDVSMFLTGEPECMVDFQPQETTRYVTLFVDVAEMSEVTKKQFELKAIAAGCLVDELESNGVRVELIAVGYTHITKGGPNVYLESRVTIKKFMEKLSLAQLTGALATSYFRRLTFAFIEKYYAKHGDVPSGYGKLSMFPTIDGVYMKNITRGAVLNTLNDAKVYADDYLNQILKQNI